MLTSCAGQRVNHPTESHYGSSAGVCLIVEGFSAFSLHVQWRLHVFRSAKSNQCKRVGIAVNSVFADVKLRTARVKISQALLRGRLNAIKSGNEARLCHITP